MSKHDFDIPTGLSREGRKAALAIKKRVIEAFGPDVDGGGCRAFYTPKEWRGRGEEYGTNAELIVVYDGGQMRPFFEEEGYGWDLVNSMYEVIGNAFPGAWYEHCTCWYSAVYKD